MGGGLGAAGTWASSAGSRMGAVGSVQGDGDCPGNGNVLLLRSSIPMVSLWLLSLLPRPSW